jgi:hypothetical protein
MLTVTAVETALSYILTVTDGTKEQTYQYEWGKEPPEGQTLTEYLQSCKREAELLARWEIDQKAAPTPIQI